MKKHTKFVVALLAFCLCLTSLVSANTTFLPEAGKGNNKGNTSTSSSTSGTTTAPFYGRFVIPAYNISVALYNSNAQSVIDAEDSACFFNVKGYNGMIIGEHHHQNFWDLPYVTVGTVAQILLPNGGIINMICVESYAGKNAGTTITDTNGRTVIGDHDYLAYTCLPGAGNIHICQWDITSAQGIDPQYDNGFAIDSRTKSRVAAFVPTTQNTTSSKAKKGKNK